MVAEEEGAPAPPARQGLRRQQQQGNQAAAWYVRRLTAVAMETYLKLNKDEKDLLGNYHKYLQQL